MVLLSVAFVHYTTKQTTKTFTSTQRLPRLLMKILHFTAVIVLFLYIYSNTTSCLYVQYMVSGKINLC